MKSKSFISIYKIFILTTIIVSVALLIGVVFSSYISAAANANPTWYVGERLIYHGQANPYDYYAAKDPTIVYADGKYHVFYTGANQSGGWQMLYTSASTLEGLKTAPRRFMSSIQESYFCAPQVFYFEPHGLWYLIYQDGNYGCAYSTTRNIGDPNSWDGPHGINITGNTGLDYFVVCDDNYAYMYNSPNDRNVYVRRTALSNFPQGWGSPSVAIRDTWEGHNIYKSLADGKYYMMVEDYLDQRYYELWTSSSAGGPWTQIAEKWAYGGNLSYTADRWTTMVSHGEVIRAGINQKMEINDINKVDFLIQGTTSQAGEYHNITWDLGIIKNYTGSSPTIAPVTPTPIPEERSAYEQIEAESFNNQSGIQTETCSEGGENVGYIENGDYIGFSNIDFGSGAGSFEARVASGTSGGNIEIRLDSANGTLIGTCPVSGTGDWQNWTTLVVNVNKVSGNHDLYLVFTGGSDYLMNINWLRFKTSSTVTPTPTGTCGDVNSSGNVDITDALLISQFYVGGNPDNFNQSVADVNGDGSVNIQDALLVAQYYVGIVNTLSCN